MIVTFLKNLDCDDLKPMLKYVARLDKEDVRGRVKNLECDSSSAYEVAEAFDELRNRRKKYKSKKGTYFHITTSPAPEESIADDKYLEETRDMIESTIFENLGFEDAAYYSCVHTDTDHPHLHIVGSYVSTKPPHEKMSDYMIGRKLNEARKQIEAKLGETETVNRTMTQAELAEWEAAVRKVLEDASKTSWKAFHEDCLKQGVIVFSDGETIYVRTCTDIRAVRLDRFLEIFPLIMKMGMFKNPSPLQLNKIVNVPWTSYRSIGDRKAVEFIESGELLRLLGSKLPLTDKDAETGEFPQWDNETWSLVDGYIKYTGEESLDALIGEMSKYPYVVINRIDDEIYREYVEFVDKIYDFAGFEPVSEPFAKSVRNLAEKCNTWEEFHRAARKLGYRVRLRPALDFAVEKRFVKPVESAESGSIGITELTELLGKYQAKDVSAQLNADKALELTLSLFRADGRDSLQELDEHLAKIGIQRKTYQDEHVFLIVADGCFITNKKFNINDFKCESDVKFKDVKLVKYSTRDWDTYDMEHFYNEHKKRAMSECYRHRARMLSAAYHLFHFRPFGLKNQNLLVNATLMCFQLAYFLAVASIYVKIRNETVLSKEDFVKQCQKSELQQMKMVTT